MIYGADMELLSFPFIECPQCNIKSYNTNDIKYRYCNNCHEYHEEMDFEAYLIDSGWIKATCDQWIHPDSIPLCHTSIALLVQKNRDKYEDLPWYKKLLLKIRN